MRFEPVLHNRFSHNPPTTRPPLV